MITYKTSLCKYDLVRTVTDFPKSKIQSSKDAFNTIMQFCDASMMIQEISYVIYLNRANNTIGVYGISKGGIMGTVIDTQLIAKCAIELLAKGVILFHNHPSGNQKPSDQDINITKKIQEGLKLFDINLLDHIIIIPDIYAKWSKENTNYFSFADEGLI